MNGKRILGLVFAGILASSLGTLAACGGTPESKEAATGKVVNAASVRIELFDMHDVKIGEGSGVMIAPRLVLTSGHLISGAGKWVVTSADGQKVTGSRGMTYDWMKYDSNKAHPRRHDVGVIHLNETLKLSSYPKLVGEATIDGSKAMRVRSGGSSFEEIDVSLAKVRSSPNAWLTAGKGGETIDTGGAVYDARGILGVVSGRGNTTGKLYIARVDGLVKWLAPKVACAGGATGTRTLAEPAIDKSKEICDDAGTGSGASSGGTNGSGSDGSSGSCDGNNDGVCSGTCLGTAGGGGVAGSGGTGTSGSDGTPGGDGTPDGSGTPGSSGTGGSSGEGSSGTNGTVGSSGGSTSGGAGGSSGEGSSGTNGTVGSSGGSTSGGGAGGTSGEGSSGTNSAVPGGSGGSGSNEACQGASDTPEVCPPEPFGCLGSSCGGGQPDDTMDYGSCAACGSSSGDDDIYLR